MQGWEYKHAKGAGRMRRSWGPRGPGEGGRGEPKIELRSQPFQRSSFFLVQFPRSGTWKGQSLHGSFHSLDAPYRVRDGYYALGKIKCLLEGMMMPRWWRRRATKKEDSAKRKAPGECNESSSVRKSLERPNTANKQAASKAVSVSDRSRYLLCSRIPIAVRHLPISCISSISITIPLDHRTCLMFTSWPDTFAYTPKQVFLSVLCWFIFARLIQPVP